MIRWCKRLVALLARAGRVVLAWVLLQAKGLAEALELPPTKDEVDEARRTVEALAGVQEAEAAVPRIRSWQWTRYHMAFAVDPSNPPTGRLDLAAVAAGLPLPGKPSAAMGLEYNNLPAPGWMPGGCAFHPTSWHALCSEPLVPSIAAYAARALVRLEVMGKRVAEATLLDLLRGSTPCGPAVIEERMSFSLTVDLAHTGPYMDLAEWLSQRTMEVDESRRAALRARLGEVERSAIMQTQEGGGDVALADALALARSAIDYPPIAQAGTPPRDMLVWIVLEGNGATPMV